MTDSSPDTPHGATAHGWTIVESFKPDAESPAGPAAKFLVEDPRFGSLLTWVHGSEGPDGLALIACIEDAARLPVVEAELAEARASRRRTRKAFRYMRSEKRKADLRASELAVERDEARGRADALAAKLTAIATELDVMEEDASPYPDNEREQGHLDVVGVIRELLTSERGE